MSHTLIAFVRTLVVAWNKLRIEHEDLYGPGSALDQPAHRVAQLDTFSRRICDGIKAWVATEDLDRTLEPTEDYLTDLIQKLHLASHGKDLTEMSMTMDALALNLYRWDEEQAPAPIPYVYRPTAGAAISHLDDGGRIEQRTANGQWGKFNGGRSWFEGMHPEATDYQLVDQLRLVPLPPVKDHDTDGLLSGPEVPMGPETEITDPAITPPAEREALRHRIADSARAERDADQVFSIKANGPAFRRWDEVTVDPAVELSPPGPVPGPWIITRIRPVEAVPTWSEPHYHLRQGEGVHQRRLTNIPESALTPTGGNMEHPAPESLYRETQMVGGRSFGEQAFAQGLMDDLRSQGVNVIAIGFPSDGEHAAGLVTEQVEVPDAKFAEHASVDVLDRTLKVLFSGTVVGRHYEDIGGEWIYAVRNDEKQSTVNGIQERSLVKWEPKTEQAITGPRFRDGTPVKVDLGNGPGGEGDPVSTSGHIVSSEYVEGTGWTYTVQPVFAMAGDRITEIPEANITPRPRLHFSMRELHGFSVAEAAFINRLAGHLSRGGSLERKVDGVWCPYRPSLDRFRRDVMKKEAALEDVRIQESVNDTKGLEEMANRIVVPQADPGVWKPGSGYTGEIKVEATDGPYQYEVTNPTFAQLFEHRQAGGTVQVQIEGPWRDATPTEMEEIEGNVDVTEADGGSAGDRVRLVPRETPAQAVARLQDRADRLQAQLSAERSVCRLHHAPKEIDEHGPSEEQLQLAFNAIDWLLSETPPSKTKRQDALKRILRYLGKELAKFPDIDTDTPEHQERVRHLATTGLVFDRISVVDPETKEVDRTLSLSGGDAVRVLAGSRPGSIQARITFEQPSRITPVGQGVSHDPWSYTFDEEDGVRRWRIVSGKPGQQTTVVSGKYEGEAGDRSAMLSNICQVHNHYRMRWEADTIDLLREAGVPFLPAMTPVPEGSEVWAMGDWYDGEWVGHEGLTTDAPLRSKPDPQAEEVIKALRGEGRTITTRDLDQDTASSLRGEGELDIVTISDEEAEERHEIREAYEAVDGDSLLGVVPPSGTFGEDIVVPLEEGGTVPPLEDPRIIDIHWSDADTRAQAVGRIWDHMKAGGRAEVRDLTKGGWSDVTEFFLGYPDSSILASYLEHSESGSYRLLGAVPEQQPSLTDPKDDEERGDFIEGDVVVIDFRPIDGEVKHWANGKVARVVDGPLPIGPIGGVYRVTFLDDTLLGKDAEPYMVHGSWLREYRSDGSIEEGGVAYYPITWGNEIEMLNAAERIKGHVQIGGRVEFKVGEEWTDVTDWQREESLRVLTRRLAIDGGEWRLVEFEGQEPPAGAPDGPGYPQTPIDPLADEQAPPAFKEGDPVLYQCPDQDPLRDPQATNIIRVMENGVMVYAGPRIGIFTPALVVPLDHVRLDETRVVPEGMRLLVPAGSDHQDYVNAMAYIPGAVHEVLLGEWEEADKGTTEVLVDNRLSDTQGHRVTVPAVEVKHPERIYSQIAASTIDEMAKLAVRNGHRMPELADDLLALILLCRETVELDSGVSDAEREATGEIPETAALLHEAMDAIEPMFLDARIEREVIMSFVERFVNYRLSLAPWTEENKPHADLLLATENALRMVVLIDELNEKVAAALG